MLQEIVRIMLVDDEDDHHLITRMVLRKAGFTGELLAFHDAEDALSALRTAAPPPDLLLIDINMPGTSGFDMIQRCEAEALLPNGHTLVVMCSSSNRPMDIDVARRSPCVDEYVEKSIDVDKLERLGHLFRQKRA